MPAHEKFEPITVAIDRHGNMIVATVAGGPQVGIAGYGENAAEALRDLAAAIQFEKWPLPERGDPIAGRLIRIK